MMGSSLLALSWAIKASGLAMGFGIVMFMTIIAYYTAYLVISLHAKHNSRQKILRSVEYSFSFEIFFSDNPTLIPEFPQLCGKLLGKPWEYICLVFSILIMQGVAIVYCILMSNFLYDTVEFMIQGINGTPSHSSNASVIDVICPSNSANFNATTDESDNPYFNRNTAPLYLIVLLPIISVKSPTFFTKFSSLGTLNVFFLIGVVVFLSGSWGLHVDFTNPESDEFVPMIKSTFPSLSGMMAMGLFIHSVIITIMKNNRYQENNVS